MKHFVKAIITPNYITIEDLEELYNLDYEFVAGGLHGYTILKKVDQQVIK